MANQGKPPLLEFPQQGIVPNVHSFHATATITCSCGGNPDPIVVHFLPGVPLKAFCKACRTEFVVARIKFDAMQKDGELQVAVGAIEPKIATPLIKM
jgi:hypothetical protein